MERALIYCGFAEVTERHLIGALVLGGESGAGCKSNLSADDCVTAKKPELLVKHVHRATLAFGASGGFAEKLGHDRTGGHSLGKCETVFTITGEYVVVFTNGRDRTDADGFLTDVKVAETADLSGDVRFRRLLFEATNQEHLAIEIDRLLAGKSTEPIFLTLFRLVSFLFKF